VGRSEREPEFPYWPPYSPKCVYNSNLHVAAIERPGTPRQRMQDWDSKQESFQPCRGDSANKRLGAPTPCNAIYRVPTTAIPPSATYVHLFTILLSLSSLTIPLHDLTQIVFFKFPIRSKPSLPLRLPPSNHSNSGTGEGPGLSVLDTTLVLKICFPHCTTHKRRSLRGATCVLFCAAYSVCVTWRWC
jgi:hypothetical protein